MKRLAQPRTWRWHWLGAWACVAVLPAAPAHAGLFDDEEARKAILGLRAQITQLEQGQQQSATRQTELSDQITLLKRSLLELNNQIETLRTEIAALRGQGEVSGQGLAREVAEMQRRQKDAAAAMALIDERLRKLEPQKVSLDGKEVAVDSAERKAYDDAILTLRKGEFSAAATQLQAFQQRYPGSPYAGHVTYWLGNAQYSKGDLKDAMASFRSLVQTQPQHPRAAEALLSIANCQAELKDFKGARKTLEELLKTYPQSEAAQAGKERLALLK